MGMSFRNRNAPACDRADTLGREVRPYDGGAVWNARTTVVGAHGMRPFPGRDAKGLPRRRRGRSGGGRPHLWTRPGVARGSRPGLIETASPRLIRPVFSPGGTS